MSETSLRGFDLLWTNERKNRFGGEKQLPSNRRALSTLVIPVLIPPPGPFIVYKLILSGRPSCNYFNTRAAPRYSVRQLGYTLGQQGIALPVTIEVCLVGRVHWS